MKGILRLRPTIIEKPINSGQLSLVGSAKRIFNYGGDESSQENIKDFEPHIL